MFDHIDGVRPLLHATACVSSVFPSFRLVSLITLHVCLLLCCDGVRRCVCETQDRSGSVDFGEFMRFMNEEPEDTSDSAKAAASAAAIAASEAASPHPRGTQAVHELRRRIHGFVERNLVSGWCCSRPGRKVCAYATWQPLFDGGLLCRCATWPKCLTCWTLTTTVLFAWYVLPSMHWGLVPRGTVLFRGGACCRVALH